MKIKNGKFWMLDEFIDENAKKLTPYDQAVYMALCRHLNSDGETFVSNRTIAAKLGINKNTVSSSIKHLKAYGLVIQLSGGRGKQSRLKIIGVSFKDTQLYHPAIHKEADKEDIKEESAHFTNQKTPKGERVSDGCRQNIRELLTKKGIIGRKIC